MHLPVIALSRARATHALGTLVLFSLLLGASTAEASPAACPALGPSVVPVAIHNPGAAFNDFFIVVKVDTASLITANEMRTDGGDIRFAASDCVPLDYWIQSGLNTTETTIWVKVPTVPSGSSEFGLYYGDSSATHTNQPSDVFGTGIASLYTFTEGAGSTVTDWVGGHDLTLSGATWTTGPRDGIAAVAGFTSGSFTTGNRLIADDAGPSLGAGDFTVITVLKPAPADFSGTHGIIGSYPNDVTPGWLMKFQGAAGQFMLLTNHNGSWCQSAGGSVAADTWTALAGRRVAGVTNSLFQDGVFKTNLCAGDTRDLDSSAGRLEMGRAYTGNVPMNGAVSASIIYNRALSDAEIASVSKSFVPGIQPLTYPGGTVPDAPAILTSSSSATELSFSLSTPYDGGTPLTGYKVTCVGGGGTVSATGASPTLTISGLPSDTAYSCTAQAINDLGAGAASTPASLTTKLVPGITSAASATFTIGASGSFTVTTVGKPTPTVSVAGSLPSGVTYDAGTQTFSGTPALGTAGSYALTLTASNGLVPNAVQAFTLTVGKTSQTITFAAPPPLVSGVTEAPFTASASSGLPVTVTSSTPGVCQVKGSVVAAIAAGSCTLVARQPGNADYLAAPDVSRTIAVESTLPEPPIHLRAAITNEAELTLEWEAAPTGAPATRFAVEGGNAPGRTTLPVGTTTETRTVVILPSGTYYFRVRGINAAGQSSPSDEVSVTVSTPLAVPLPPADFQVGIAGAHVTLSWSAGARPGALSGRRIELGTSLDTADLGVFDIGASGPVGADLDPGDYVVRLRSLAPFGMTSPSQSVAFTVGPVGSCTEAPGLPVLLTPTVNGSAVTLSWLPASGARASSYRLEVAGTSEGPVLAAMDTFSTASSIVVPAPTGTYWARIVATNACGESAPSAYEPVVVGTPLPGAPSGLTAAVTGHQVTLSWQAPTPDLLVQGYLLQAGVSTDRALLSTRTDANTRTVTFADVPSGTYYVRVSALNETGTGPASSIVQVIVP